MEQREPGIPLRFVRPWSFLCVVIVLSGLAAMPVAADAAPDFSLSAGLSATITAIGPVLDIGCGPMHVGASLRYHTLEAFKGFPYADLLWDVGMTTDLYDGELWDLRGGLGATGYLDLESKDHVAVIGARARLLLSPSGWSGSLYADVIAPFKFLIHEETPLIESDLPPSVAFMAVYVLVQVVSIGWVWTW